MHHGRDFPSVKGKYVHVALRTRRRWAPVIREVLAIRREADGCSVLLVVVLWLLVLDTLPRQRTSESRNEPSATAINPISPAVRSALLVTAAIHLPSGDQSIGPKVLPLNRRGSRNPPHCTAAMRNSASVLVNQFVYDLFAVLGNRRPL